MQIPLTTQTFPSCDLLQMAKPVILHPDAPLRGRHYIVEWAEKAEMSQADIARAMEVDKSVVSRWFSGNRPQDRHLQNLATVLDAPEPMSLFRHPTDDWVARFFAGRDEDERRRMMQTLESAFPRRSA